MNDTTTSPSRPRKTAKKGRPAPASRVEPARAAPGQLPVLIDVGRHITAGATEDRYDIAVRARVVSFATIVEVALLVDDEPRSVTRYAAEPSDIAEALPNGLLAQQRSAQFNLALPASAVPKQLACQIRALDTDGVAYLQEFVLGIEREAETPVCWLAGPMQPEAAERVRIPAILHVERAVLDDQGALLIEGWGIALHRIRAIEAHVGTQRVVGIGGLERGDVAAAFPAYPNSSDAGFRITHDVADPSQAPAFARVELHCREGLSYEVVVPIRRGAVAVTPEPAPPPPPEPPPEPPPPPPPPPPIDQTIHHSVDSARLDRDGHLEVSGWALSAVGIGRILLSIDDAVVGHAELGHERPDLITAHPTIKRATLGGFRFSRRVADRMTGAPVVKLIIETLEETREELTLKVDIPPEPPPPPKPELPEPDGARMKFQLDTPRISGGRVEEVVAGRLTVDGWVLSHSPIVAMEVWMAAQRLGEAHHGLARQDVAAAFPEWPNAERGGFAFHCPPRGLRDGVHELRLITRCEDGYTHEIAFQVEVKRSDAEREAVSIRRRLAFTGQTLLRDTLRRLGVEPVFDIVLRQGSANLAATSLTLRSLAAQVVVDYRVTILADAGDETARAALTAMGDDFAKRVTILTPVDPGWTAPFGAAGDNFTLMLTSGDELGVDALAELAVAHGLYPDARTLYADETRISPVSQEREAFLKPDCSPDLLLSTNYIGRPWAARGGLLAALGASPASLTEMGEYDLILRCAERAGRFRHVPKVLCRRGAGAIDSVETDHAALTRAIERRAIAASIEPGALPGFFRTRRTAPVAGKVSIIIPTRAARGLIGVCLNTLKERTTYKNFEIVVLDNIPLTEPAWLSFVHRVADKVERIDAAFNWSRFNNRAAARAEGEFLLFLNDDIEIIDPDWLTTLVQEAARPEIGVVGARLLYPNRTVQHAGMFLATNGVARHAFRFAAEDDPGYFGLALTQRDVSAVTGACYMVRRDVFDQLGGFDEAHEVVNNDLDFCLRAGRAGYRVIYTPHATLIHHEQASRDRMTDVYDTSHFDSAWADLFTAGDPYFNPRLYRHADDHRPDDEPVEPVFSGRPLFDPASIERLLVIKLDHIGDFVTALPSIRRLKSLFPAARITVLAAPAAQSFAAFEPAIDEFIAFEFFHVKSGLGRKEVTDTDLAELGRRLAPHRFDLAIDLRKQPDTREVLRRSGARYMAGFDHQARFNFLDIALEWESDRGLHNKRNHVSDDLLNLVEAVGQATTSHQPRLDVPETLARAALEGLAEPIQPLFAKPVVFVHPGVGSAVKQWPLGHFSALINLLIARHGVNVVVIGSPDEAELAHTVIQGVRDQTAIGSVVGQTKLRDLPALLANAALFIGNDSGPKHIAAAVGVPTIGIHSGVVDTMEWGPVGPTAIALKRGMACSPCYLARIEDCPRDLACLKALEPTLVYEAAVTMLGRPLTTPLPPEKEPPMTRPKKPKATRGATGRKGGRA